MVNLNYNNKRGGVTTPLISETKNVYENGKAKTRCKKLHVIWG